MVKDTVLLQNQKALMPDAKLNCLLGGMVSIILPQIEIVLMLSLCQIALIM